MTVTELAEALRPVILEVVKSAMQSELREILTEAVEIASRPVSQNDQIFEIEETAAPVHHLDLPKPSWVQELEKSKPKETVTTALKESKTSKERDYEQQKNVLFGLLGETAKHMSPEDKKNFA